MTNTKDSYKNKLKLNSLSAIVLQIVTALSGIILPKIIITNYGSNVNGLIASITQFLSYISLLETGIGGVVRAALYKPLTQGDTDRVSVIICTCRRFFKRLSYIFLGYLILIAVLYPFIGEHSGFDYSFVFLLTIISGALTFAQYYFCLSYQLLLQSDQKLYVVNNLQTFALVVNIIATILLVKLGVGILLLRVVFMLIFISRPVLINLYVKKRYNINNNVSIDTECIKQRWDGLGHHIAFFVHKNTDIVILTFFCKLSDISVYAIYQSIITAIQGLIASVSSSLSAALGTLYAKEDKEELKSLFVKYETFIFIISTFVFSVSAVMITSFIKVYTSGVNDANYIRPYFGLIFVLAEFFYTIRLPYSNLALSAGFFKETRNGAFLEAIINIGVSIILVKPLGIIGVAIGTLVAMLYRTTDFVFFLQKNILKRNVKHYAYNLLLSAIAFGLVYWIGTNIITVSKEINNYFEWIVQVTLVSILSLVIVSGVNIIFNIKSTKDVIDLLLKKVKNKR